MKSKLGNSVPAVYHDEKQRLELEWWRHRGRDRLTGGELLLACRLSSRPSGTETVAMDRELILSLLAGCNRIRYERIYKIYSSPDSQKSYANCEDFWVSRLSSIQGQ